LISQDESEYNQEVLFNNIIRNIEQLNYRLVQPFKLFVEGYSYKEIARKLNLKIETVTKRIFIARYQLMLQDI
jgi:DNA-directed RNA polymerase specialized sigma24 family protein